jgi:transcriptional regulator with XRE-family HTH domain
MLTAKQRRVLNAINDFTERHKYMPTVRELCNMLGLASTSTMHQHLVRLEEKGYIERNKTMPRAMKVLEMSPPPPMADTTPLTFGGFIRQKREEMEVTLKEMARQMNISQSHLNLVEWDRRRPFSLDKQEILARVLELSEADKLKMFDLSGVSNNIYEGLEEYIKERYYVRDVLRLARDLDVGEKEWLIFAEIIKRVKGV